MTVAAGIHAHPTRKLGLKPSDPAKPVLALRDFLTGVVPPHPANVDHTTGVTPGLYRNDTFGVCGPTEVCNDRRLITHRAGHYAEPSQDDCFDLYRRSGNPSFDPATGADDNGVDMKTMLSAVVKGGVGGTKALGFAAVDVTNSEELKAAVDIFGSLHIAVDLQVAQQTQTDAGEWTYSSSGEWGGHAILVVKYGPSEKFVWTWEELVGFDATFEAHQLQEAYVVIWPEHEQNPALYESMNMPAFAQAYQAITGRPYPGAVTPPAPTPAPTPVPASTVRYEFAAADGADLEAWAVAPHVWSKATRAAKAWKRGTAS
jgi:hypothetical protein